MGKEKDLKLKRLELVFENLEVAELTPNLIDKAGFCKMDESLHINSFQYREGEILRPISCDCFYVYINNKGLKTQVNLFSDVSEYSLEDRLQYRDITHVNLVFDNEEEKYITLPWEEKEKINVNILQHNIPIYNDNKKDGMLVIIQLEPLTLEELEEDYGIEIIGKY